MYFDVKVITLSYRCLKDLLRKLPVKKHNKLINTTTFKETQDVLSKHAKNCIMIQ